MERDPDRQPDRLNRWRRLPRPARVLVGVVVVVGVLYGVSSCRHQPQDRAAFFTPGDEPLVVAHQGGELLRPSNTMVAFRHAVDLGADVLDADLHRTADGVLVLLHDETVDRTSDGTGAVADLTIDQLRALDFGHRFDPDGSATYPFRGQGIGIVTVDELFAEFGAEVRYGIEIKQTGTDAANELCATIRRFDLVDHVLVSSFGQDAIDRFRSACPEVATSATEREVTIFYVLHRLGLSGLDRPGYEALQLPERSAGQDLLSTGVLDDARGWGLAVVPWTIDDPDTMRELLGRGVDGINTNRPDLLIEIRAELAGGG